MFECPSPTSPFASSAPSFGLFTSRMKAAVLSGAVALSLGFAAPTTLATDSAPKAAAVSLSSAATRLVDGVVAKAGHAPAAYRAERDRAVQTLRSDARLRDEVIRAAETMVTSSNFDRVVVVRILAERLRHENADAQLENLNGLTASHYLKRRRPRAGAVNELIRRDVPAPLLYERLAFTRDQAFAQTTAPDAFPPKHAKAAAEWIAKERAGHVEALVHALGESGDAIAPIALQRHLATAQGTDAATTLLAMGKTREPSLLPIFVAAVDGKNVDAQQTAVVALGHLRTKEATDVLARLTRHTSASVRVPAIRSLGVAASVRAKDAGQPERLEVALAALVPLLEADALAPREADAVVQTLSQLPSSTTRSMVAKVKSPRADIVLRRLDRKARRTRR